MKLNQLLQNINIISKKIVNDSDIKGIAIDSRKIEEGFAFICFEGTKSDGHDFIKNAIEKGATTIITQKAVEDFDNVNIVQVESGRETIAKLANNFYENPSKKFKLIGITGTKGKTTTTYMIKSILEQKGLKVGLIGTIESKIGDQSIKTSDNTTPDAVELQGTFDFMAKNNVDVVVMEVSSHALDLKRVYGSDFDIGLFTNLSQDHLDYHKDFETYFAAKKLLFSQCRLGIVNIDSQYGKRVMTETECSHKTYAIDSEADIRASDLHSTSKYVRFNVGERKFTVKIPGKFSVYNALSSISVARELGCSDEEIQAGFDNLTVPGRSEIVHIDADYTVMVDYAHSPESLKSILLATKEYAKGRVICVFGCGGDRDRTKRPIMGRISGEIADYTIITSDNPRTEEPDCILDEVEVGIKEVTNNYTRVTARELAIRESLKIARENDIIVIAGKGHEPYQILKDKTIHFDDREQVKIQYEILKTMKCE